MIQILLVVPNADDPSGLPTTGLDTYVNAVPRVGEDVTLGDSDGANRKLTVESVRHVFFTSWINARAGSQIIEVTLK